MPVEYWYIELSHSAGPVVTPVCVVAGTNPTLSSGDGLAALPAPHLAGGPPLRLNRHLHPLIDLTTLEVRVLSQFTLQFVQIWNFFV